MEALIWPCQTSDKSLEVWDMVLTWRGYERKTVEYLTKAFRTSVSRFCDRHEVKPNRKFDSVWGLVDWNFQTFRPHFLIQFSISSPVIIWNRRIEPKFGLLNLSILGGLDGPWWEKGCFAALWVELRRLLSESQSLSSERRRTHGTPKMNSWRFFEGSSASAIVRRQRPAPGQVMTVSPTTTWTGCIFIRLLVNDQDRTTTYRVTTCATATRLSLVVWHVWRFLVRYNNRRRRRWVDQNDRSFLSFSSISNWRTALKLGTTDLPGLRNTLVQKKKKKN